MKWLKIILSFYILALSCMPCMCDDMHPTNKSEFSQASNSKEHNEDEDCSPFCSCGSCASSVLFSIADFEITNADVLLYASVEKFYPSNSSFVSYNNCNIWQPPKNS